MLISLKVMLYIVLYFELFMGKVKFLELIEMVKEYICVGDVMQVVLGYCMVFDFDGEFL